MLRPDLSIIAEWITPGSRVLDLGCGDGALLKHLIENKQVNGYGLEINDTNLERCIADDINVIQADLNQGLSQYFDDNSFDFVVMSQTLQATDHPDLLIDEILRVGKQGIVTFPNMAYWKGRLQLGLEGVDHVVGVDPVVHRGDDLARGRGPDDVQLRLHLTSRDERDLPVPEEEVREDEVEDQQHDAGHQRGLQPVSPAVLVLNVRGQEAVDDEVLLGRTVTYRIPGVST